MYGRKANIYKLIETHSLPQEFSSLDDEHNEIVNSSITNSVYQPLSSLKQLSSRVGDGYGKKEKTYA